MDKKHVFENKHGVRVVVKASARSDMNGVLAVPPTPNEMEDIETSMADIIRHNQKLHGAEITQAAQLALKHVDAVRRSHVE